MLERRPGIYAITCSVTGKQYIGSSNSVRQRIWSHQSELRRGVCHSLIMQSEWNKYGEDAFSYEVLEYIENTDDLIPREQYYLDTLHPALNIRTIADRNIDVKIAPEAIEKRRAKLLHHKTSQETRDRISRSLMGRPHSPERLQHVTEANRRIAAAKKGKPRPLEARINMRTGQKLRRAKEKEQALRTLREPIIPSTAEEWKQGLTAPSLWDEEASD